MVSKAETAQIKELLKQQSYQEAYDACQQLLQKAPDSFEVNVFAGKAAVELRHFDEVGLAWVLAMHVPNAYITACRLVSE